MEFLMRLNKNYEDIRGSILSVEPIPSLNKVFQLVHQAEKQKQVTGCLQDGLELNALNVNKQYHNQGYDHKKDFRKSKMDKKCDYCGIKGHLKAECFKLVGYPERFKGGKAVNNYRTAPNVEKVGYKACEATPC